MNTFYKEIQKSFDLLDNPKTKKDFFLTGLEFMLKIANQSKHETETCTITKNEAGEILIVLKTKESQLTISANSRISYIGTGPCEEDRIQVLNTESYYVSDEVLQWIRRNSKKNKN